MRGHLLACQGAVKDDDLILPVDILAVDWPQALSLSACAALVSLLTSIGSDWVSAADGPSLTDAEVLAGD